MNTNVFRSIRTLCAASLMALGSLTAAHAQTAKPMAPSASMPMGMPMAEMHKGAGGGHDAMKQSMASGMEAMQKMPMSGDTDKDFAAMMKIHHQGALDMAKIELEQGKSPEMKAMARSIIAAQKKEIAQFDRWLAKQK